MDAHLGLPGRFEKNVRSSVSSPVYGKAGKLSRCLLRDSLRIIRSSSGFLGHGIMLIRLSKSAPSSLFQVRSILLRPSAVVTLQRPHNPSPLRIFDKSLLYCQALFFLLRHCGLQCNRRVFLTKQVAKFESWQRRKYLISHVHNKK